MFGNVHGLQKLLFEGDRGVDVQCVMKQGQNEVVDVLFSHYNLGRVDVLSDELMQSLSLNYSRRKVMREHWLAATVAQLVLQFQEGCEVASVTFFLRKLHTGQLAECRGHFGR